MYLDWDLKMKQRKKGDGKIFLFWLDLNFKSSTFYAKFREFQDPLSSRENLLIGGKILNQEKISQKILQNGTKNVMI